MNEINLPEWAKHLAVFDLETTGIDEREARIVTAYIGELDAGGEVMAGGKTWLANPGIEIPATATEVHGITTEYAAANGEDAAKVTRELIERLRQLMDAGLLVVAYNAAYDFTVLHYEALRHGIEPLVPTLVFDPLVVDKEKDTYRKGKRTLEATSALYGVALDDAHEASADAIAAGRVGQRVAAKFAKDLPADAKTLHELQVPWKEAQNISFAKFMQGSVDPNFVAVPGWPVKRY